MNNKMAESSNTLRLGAIASRLNSSQFQKQSNFSFFIKQNPITMKYIKAFSVAEAMIALLIGTIVLGFSAPMISKQMKHNNFNDIQYEMLSKKIEKLNSEINTLKSQNVKLESGMVVAFNATTCPTGWTKLTELFTDSEGVFIRNIGGQALPKGEIQEDAAPNITGEAKSLEIGNHSGNVQDGALTLSLDNGEDWVGGGWGKTGKITFDASLSNEAYGRKDSTGNSATEVRPKNIAFLYCVKD